MDAPIDYAIEKATPDVARTIRWLQSEGFRVIDSVGGAGESFGNVSLTFERAVCVTIVRDRGQWAMDVAPSSSAKTHGLHVLMTAMTGAKPDSGPPDGLLPLADQLPEGLRWSSQVPELVRWLESGDRSAEIASADRLWHRAMLDFWRAVESSGRQNQRIVVSKSGGTFLGVTDGEWVLVGGPSPRPIAEAMYGLLPLLEQLPEAGVVAVKSVDGPDFPFEDLLITALSSDSGYWQEKAVPWLVTLGIDPVGLVANAASQALAKKRASQQARHQLRRWLEGKPLHRP